MQKSQPATHGLSSYSTTKPADSRNADVSPMMKMELGEYPRKFLLRVDQMGKELKRVDRPVDPKDIDIVILSGRTSQYDAGVRMLERSSDWPTRRWIERAVIKQHERLECEKSAAGSRAMLSTRGHRRNDKPPIRCPLCFRTGHSVLQCREFQTTRREGRNRTDTRGMKNIVATAEAAGMVEVAEMAKEAKTAEWAATVEAEAVRVAAGAAVSQRKVAWISNPAIRPLAPTATSV